MLSVLLLGAAGLLVVVALGSILAALGERPADEELLDPADEPVPR